MPSFRGMDDGNYVLAGSYRTPGVIKSLCLLFVHLRLDVGVVCGDVLRLVSDLVFYVLGYPEIYIFCILGSVHSLHITELFEPVDKPSSGSCRMAHFLGDIGHRQVVLTRKVGEQEKLGERDVTAVKLVGEVEDAGALCEEDKVRKTISVRLDRSS